MSEEGKSEQLRQELLKLNADRGKLEKEIKDYQAILSSQNVSSSEPLVDSEGYPRNDIDVHQIRLARNKIVCLQNDCRALMRTIESKLYEYHESLKKPSTGT